MPTPDDTSSPVSFPDSRHKRTTRQVEPPTPMDDMFAAVACAATLSPRALARLRTLIARHEQRLGGVPGMAPLDAVVDAVAADLAADPVLDAALSAWARDQVTSRDRRTLRSARPTHHRRVSGDGTGVQ